jgi:hypothetical protein
MIRSGNIAAMCIARRLTNSQFLHSPFTQVGNGILNVGTKVTAGQLTCNGAAPGSIPLPSCFKVDANTQVRWVRKGKWVGSQRGVVQTRQNGFKPAGFFAFICFICANEPLTQACPTFVWLRKRHNA